MEAKFTKGPWFASHLSVRYKAPHYTGMGEEIAQCRKGERSPDAAEANARLISAAPEMYALLEHVLERYNKPDCSGAPTPEMIFAIRDLLTKIDAGT